LPAPDPRIVRIGNPCNGIFAKPFQAKTAVYAPVNMLRVRVPAQRKVVRATMVSPHHMVAVDIILLIGAVHIHPRARKVVNGEWTVDPETPRL